MKAKTIAVFLLAGSLMAGCATKEEKEATVNNAAVDKCTFDDGKTEAPSYFCTRKVEGFSILGRGVYAKSPAGMNFMVQQAALAARVELAQTVRTQLSASTKNYLGSTGVGDATSIDAAASSTTSSLTDEALMGSTIVRQVVGPEGEVYVFVGIDDQNLVAKKQQAILSSMQNEQALWQKFQAQKSHEQMAKEIAELREYRKQQDQSAVPAPAPAQ
jgi:outer membrane lipopolysaccharide assembly protein LptE/RlpB